MNSYENLEMRKNTPTGGSTPIFGPVVFTKLSGYQAAASPVLLIRRAEIDRTS